MKFKYLSLCLCLSLFACSDDENILPEEKPAVPQGEPMEDTPIVQKDYISNSSLWMGPSLANDGFVVEVEMGAESRRGGRDRRGDGGGLRDKGRNGDRRGLAGAAGCVGGIRVTHRLYR